MPEQEWIAEAQEWVDAAEELDDGATHMLREQDILAMNMSTCKLWEREHPPVVIVEEGLEVSGFVLSPLKLKKKPSTSEDKKPNNPYDDVVVHGVAAAVASQPVEVQLLAKALDLHQSNEA